MALMNENIRSLGKAEFLNLTPLDINPGISKCEIAVAYEGKNRNGSYITHEEMEDLGRTMRGIPIVGYYSEEKGDFRDHGHKVTLDADGIKEEVMTVPYGFISPDADVWFQEVEENTKFGPTQRTYLMCTGYLWTESFPESRLALNGRPQSMELDPDRLEGHWAEVDEFGMEFFIIDKGSTLSKLCILGMDVPPCFEGAEITSPQLSRNFALNVDDGVLEKLAAMTEELKFALSAEGGLNSVEDEKNISVEFEDEGGEPTDGENEVQEEEQEGQEEGGDEGNDQPPAGGGLLGGGLGSGFGSGNTPINPDGGGSGDTGNGSDGGNTPIDPGGGGDDPDDPDDPDKPDDPQPEPEPTPDPDPDADDVETNVRQVRRIYTDEELDAMEAELAELRQFKAMVEDARKDEVIARYAMLSDEDKADVVEHKHEYTVEEIDEKLALIYVRKNVVFDEAVESENEENGVNTTFSLDFNSNTEYVPQMVSALRRTRQNNKR